jgi:hypothetical protein
MPIRLPLQSAAIAASVGLAFGLSACMSGGTTYGTGVPAGKQTLQDLSGLVSLSKPKRHIDYAQRPPLVEPPKTAALSLPAPGADVAAPDWPNDPDAAERARLAALHKRKPGDHTGDVTIDIPVAATSRLPPPNHVDTSYRFEDPKKVAEQQKLFAEAKANTGLGKRDANGNLIRQSLYEPPVTYLEPDPTAPTVTIDPKKKKKFHWPWARAD